MLLRRRRERVVGLARDRGRAAVASDPAPEPRRHAATSDGRERDAHGPARRRSPLDALTSRRRPAPRPRTRSSTSASRWPSCAACGSTRARRVSACERDASTTASAATGRTHESHGCELQPARVERDAHDEPGDQRDPGAAAEGEVERRHEHEQAARSERARDRPSCRGRRTRARRPPHRREDAEPVPVADRRVEPVAGQGVVARRSAPGRAGRERVRADRPSWPRARHPASGRTGRAGASASTATTAPISTSPRCPSRIDDDRSIDQTLESHVQRDERRDEPEEAELHPPDPRRARRMSAAAAAQKSAIPLQPHDVGK